MSFFQDALLNWFEKNRRNFPWREEKDPFKILVAEMMLQRTKAEQVFPVYAEFIERFPDVKTLAHARLKDISAFMQKLGLFWRSRLIKEMATNILIDHNGIIPTHGGELLKIPGIGEYITDAIIVFAFNGRRTVIDSNVVRLVSRFFGISERGEMRRNRKFIEFCQTLSHDLELKHVKNFNWGIIDHSSAICRPVPLCNACPLASRCNYLNRRINNKTQ